MSVILSAENVSRDFKISDQNIVHALKNINIEIEQGKLTVLRGRSGSGKTTLINILGCLDRPTEGKVMFLDEDLTSLSDGQRDEKRRYDMAFVFQSVALISSMTGYENVEFGLRLSGYPAAKRDERVKECLANVGLAKRMHHRPGEMSGGEQQRVAIARAIAHSPKIIFADEPTAELDTQTALYIVKLFKELVAKEGMTIVMTTHDPSMMDVADKVYTLEDGEIVE
ncbi:MAG: ABC transporter ATP-binding protein [Ruminococcus sp.]|nr:ABC transporter ATP-binding protein [Ruminococcus sp.]MCD7727614.1 ABC transporter ATP-binding protein [Ruminococcus sp.]MCD7772474.1 ABC transporter ATP-binding protein [Ruminococcus sp.]MCD8327947.1 ABC transporter ATP-binding protein [Ruminococcus sp.]